jgi:D-serine deaminase-like pyridoxal phosphate-dependent protein
MIGFMKYDQLGCPLAFMEVDRMENNHIRYLQHVAA